MGGNSSRMPMNGSAHRLISPTLALCESGEKRVLPGCDLI